MDNSTGTIITKNCDRCCTDLQSVLKNVFFNYRTVQQSVYPLLYIFSTFSRFTMTTYCPLSGGDMEPGHCGMTSAGAASNGMLCCWFHWKTRPKIREPPFSARRRLLVTLTPCIMLGLYPKSSLTKAQTCCPPFRLCIFRSALLNGVEFYKGILRGRYGGSRKVRHLWKSLKSTDMLKV